MSKCKKCLSEQVCRYNDGINLYCKDDYDCPHFAHKDDYVELVRCGKCRYGDVSTISKAKDGEEEIACYCTLKKVVTNTDSYCPSGRRRDT